jgi:YgiT-type zinc finger domain-containing protein
MDAASRSSVESKLRESFSSSQRTFVNEGLRGGEIMYEYGGCQVCGARMKEKRVKQNFWIKGKLVVIESIPAGVCPKCGEKVVKADVGRWIADLLRDSRRLRKAKTMSVPVIKFVNKVA